MKVTEGEIGNKEEKGREKGTLPLLLMAVGPRELFTWSGGLGNLMKGKSSRVKERREREMK